jgi:hypothetical protein
VLASQSKPALSKTDNFERKAHGITVLTVSRGKRALF